MKLPTIGCAEVTIQFGLVLILDRYVIKDLALEIKKSNLDVGTIQVILLYVDDIALVFFFKYTK